MLSLWLEIVAQLGHIKKARESRLYAILPSVEVFLARA